MFIGHYAVALVAKRVAPQTNLGILFAAVQLPDLLWPILLLTGKEKVLIEPNHLPFSPLHFTHYPISHSLLTNLGWAGLFGLAYWLITGYRKGAWAVGLGVLSHWFLDAIVHEPDLPLIPGNTARVGLGLWHSISLTIALEGLLLVGAIWYYLKATPGKGRREPFGFWLLLGLVVFLYLSGPFSPPPGDVTSLALFALSGCLIPFIAGWIDYRRTHRQASQPVNSGTALVNR
ncbi:permease [Nibrella saemangeumensis]|uniref:Permease n=1 Tax=Nibrella saemangeumensis TaxID=1084526 RepID=A0ABP8NMD7_9BACT